jgi:hypothetical protein
VVVDTLLCQRVRNLRVQQWPPDAPKRINGRPIAQWSRLEAGCPNDLGTAGR